MEDFRRRFLIRNHLSKSCIGTTVHRCQIDDGNFLWTTTTVGSDEPLQTASGIRRDAHVLHRWGGVPLGKVTVSLENGNFSRCTKAPMSALCVWLVKLDPRRTKQQRRERHCPRTAQSSLQMFAPRGLRPGEGRSRAIFSPKANRFLSGQTVVSARRQVVIQR
jgi:hypothetical protein